MPINAPRRVKSQKTRKKIFDAAAKIIKEHGEDYLTIANICEEAGVSKGTFFYHFNSKEDLMLYYLEEGLDEFIEEHDSGIVERVGNDAYALVSGLYREYLEYCLSMGIEFISSYYQPKNKALDARNVMGTPDTMNFLLRACTEGIARAQSEGLIRGDWSAADISYDCCSVIKGCVFEWCLADGSIDLVAHAEHMLHIYFNSVVTDESRARYSFNEPPLA